MTIRGEQRERFIRFQRQFARARYRRDLDGFRNGVEALLVRVESGQSLQPLTVPSGPAGPAQPPFPDRDQFDQHLRDLLVRVAGRDPLPEHDPAPGDWWSPEPVHGYRIWEVIDNDLHGARTVWETPTLSARCLRSPALDWPVPHDVDECGRPPCGIYAMKDPASIRVLAETTLSAGRKRATLAVGLVALSGRVIEHEHGYRAEVATAVGLSLIMRTGTCSVNTVVIDQPDLIAAAFASPIDVLTDHLSDPLPTPSGIERAFSALAALAAIRNAGTADRRPPSSWRGSSRPTD